MVSALPYHLQSTAYFKTQQEVWRFFADSSYKSDQLAAFKIELLKNSYKFEEQIEPGLYEKVQTAKAGLGLTLPVIIYQTENTQDTNASIVYINEEAHILFSGKLIQLLNEEELLAVIAHELSHVQLYTQQNGEVEITDRVISAIAGHQNSLPAQYETARLFKLYTELFCDRGAYTVTGDYKPIISSLIKISTGLQMVNADSYIKQAEEIFAAEANYRTMGLTHPENFIRARAIWLWHEKGPDAEPAIQKMIEGSTGLDELDIFRQQQMASLTRQLIDLLLHPEWMRTANTTALATQYFSGWQQKESSAISRLGDTIETLHPNLQDYLGYVLYDLATADKALEDVPLGYAFFLADGLRLTRSFEQAVKKEQKLTDKKIAGLKKQTLAEFHRQQGQPV